MGGKWIFATITVKLTIGPPGFEPGTARYRPRGFDLAVPRVAVYSRALFGATVHGGISSFLCVFKFFRLVWRCWGLARVFGVVDVLLLDVFPLR